MNRLAPLSALQRVVQWAKATFASRQEMETIATELANPVVLMSETAFAGITPDPSKIYIVYGE